MKQPKLFELAADDRERFGIYRRERSEEMDFRGTPASFGVYGIHPYPAMFHYLVVRRLMDEFSKEGELVFDPFMGSGVAAVESLIGGRRFVGYDINPLAVLIAKVRSTPLESRALLFALKLIVENYERTEPTEVHFHNIDYWFDAETIESLSKLKQAIYKIEDSDIRDFFKVAFSEAVRKVSRTRFNEFKLLRKENHEPQDAIRVFYELSRRNIALMSDFYRRNPPKTTEIELEARDVLGNLPLEDESVDFVVTSPPYGDSKTTVAYGQFSRLPLRWMGLDEKVDRNSLGGRAKEVHHELPSETLYRAVAEIRERSEKRAREVLSFYADLFEAVKVIARKLKAGKAACFVVGNRRVKGLELPTDKISADFFEHCGCEHHKTLVRAISNKRMPLENSPTNIRGKKDTTMRYEYIVIVRKR